MQRSSNVDFRTSMVAFAQLLRSEYEIPAGHPEAYDALRALDAMGIRDWRRVRCALRAVFCGKAEHLERFDRAFDVFFGDAARGVRQRRPIHPHGEEPGDVQSPTRREPQDRSDAQSLQAVQARYSAAAVETHETPAVPVAGLAEMLADVTRLLAALRLGHSRRWRPYVRGSRFDLRRTLRASLQTGGEPARLRTLGHPRRNPRIVVFFDASRSMSPHAPHLLQFSYALVQRSPRSSVYVFSTALREITRELRGTLRGAPQPIDALGQAWGGGTRIGASLMHFLHLHPGRVNADTLVIIASDGLDVGDTAQLEKALSELRRRSAGIVWLNPHAGKPGFAPLARGMQAALPYVCALLDAGDLAAAGAAARTIRR